jgi:Flp pilus assembly protein TadG
MRKLLSAFARRTSRGQALVETAMIISLILLLSLATFDLGRGITSHIALKEATQEAALYAGYRLNDPGVTNAELENRAQESSSAESAANANVSMGACVDDTVDHVVVTGTYDVPIITPIANFIFGPTFTLSVDLEATVLGGCP